MRLLRVSWWFLFQGVLCAVTYGAVALKTIPQGFIVTVWWSLFVMTFLKMFSWTVRAHYVDNGRPTHWTLEFAVGLGVVTLFVVNSWHFTALCVVLIMILEECMYATDPNLLL